MDPKRRNRLIVLAAAIAVAIFVVPAFGLPYSGIDYADAQPYTPPTTTPTVTPTPAATNTPTPPVGPVSASRSTLTVDNGNINADGSSVANVTVTLLDANGVPVSGKSVGLSASGGSSTISGNGTTDSNGHFTWNVHDGTVESLNYFATDQTDNIQIQQSLTISFNAFATATPTGTVTAGSGSASIGANGSLVVNPGAISGSTGAQVVGPQAPFTGVADIPGGWAPPAFVQGQAVAPPIDPGSLPGPAPAPITASISSTTGGIIIAGNIGIILPPSALASAPGGGVIVVVQPNPQVVIPGGPAQFSPNGSIANVTFTDKNNAPLTTFPALVPIEFKYNAADIGQASGNASVFTAAYVIDSNSPPLENPNGFPVNTFVIFPPQNVNLNTGTGTVSVMTQALGSVTTVITNPVGYVQTLRPDTPLYSSFDTNNATVFGTKDQYAYLQVAEPQIGSRLLVIDPATKNYSYVNATDVGPSGPPPS